MLSTFIPLALVSLQGAKPARVELTAADFFPMGAGIARTFSDTSQTTVTTTEEVGEPTKVLSQIASPVVVKQGDKIVTTYYYRVDGDTVYLIGTDPKQPLPQPMPILQFKGQGSKWTFQGPATTQKITELIQLKGESRLGKTMDIFGKKVLTIESKLEVMEGQGRGADKVEQKAIYGQGIGLIELVSTTKVGHESITTTRKLVSFQEAKSSG